jgi:DNA-binding MarR family transcriptional regulator
MRLTEQQYDILRSFENFPGGQANAADVASAVWITQDAARSAMRRLFLRGLLKRNRREQAQGFAVFAVNATGRRALYAQERARERAKRKKR